jgi:hypothetical protein
MKFHTVLLPFRLSLIALVGFACCAVMTGAQADIGGGGPAAARFSAGEGRFIRNDGQLRHSDRTPATDVLYTFTSANTSVYFRSGGMSVVFRDVSAPTPASHDRLDALGLPLPLPVRTIRTARMDMRWLGANPGSRMEAAGAVVSRSNYYLAHCPEGIVAVPEYDALRCVNLYDNIDFECRTDGARIKSEYVVYPGGDASDIRLEYPGADLRVSGDGSLSAFLPLGEIRETAPLAWQERAGHRTLVPVHFVVHDGELGFAVSPHDSALPLFIDPWASYLGGTVPASHSLFLYASSEIRSSDYNTRGDVALAGATVCLDFPVTSGAWQSTLSGGDLEDIIIVKMDKDGRILWSTYYGGSDSDAASQIRFDESSSVYFCGGTYSADFPVSSGAIQDSMRGNCDALLIKFDSSGQRKWGTFLGGSSCEGFTGVSIASDSLIVVTGGTQSSDYPTTLGAYRSSGTSVQSTPVITVLSSIGRLLWSTILGVDSTLCRSGCADSSGNIYITGNTTSSLLPVTNGMYKRTILGELAYISSFTSTGQHRWSTYWGGDAGASGKVISITHDQHVLVGGTAGPFGFITTPGAHARYMPDSNGGAFLSEFTKNGALRWSSYYPWGDEFMRINAHRAGSIYLSGSTQANPDSGRTVPIHNSPFQNSVHGLFDVYLVRLDDAGLPVAGTFFGGWNPVDDDGYHVNTISVDCAGHILIAGTTSETDMPFRETGFQKSHPTPGPKNGNNRFAGFVAVFDSNLSIPVTLISFSAHPLGNGVTLRWSVAAERGNHGWTVLRARPGGNWSAVGFVKGRGTTALSAGYEFIDELDPLDARNAILLYKLRQVDTDGGSEDSHELEVRFNASPQSAAIETVFPSPLLEDGWVSFTLPQSGDLRLSLHDLRGAQVLGVEEYLAAGRHLRHLDVSCLPRGAYWLRLHSAGTVDVRKVLVE